MFLISRKIFSEMLVCPLLLKRSVCPHHNIRKKEVFSVISAASLVLSALILSSCLLPPQHKRIEENLIFGAQKLSEQHPHSQHKSHSVVQLLAVMKL